MELRGVKGRSQVVRRGELEADDAQEGLVVVEVKTERDSIKGETTYDLQTEEHTMRVASLYTRERMSKGL